ncbi:MAG: hypothetical protein BHW64_00700 [Candidatus Melainabacteria bacterium LEY3_CP_29_8]|nr:MAG: hypothetical protein BHW64_00700 [Candidatus Melainabacteria bacterium LEY3_CP_29_8]
MAIFYYKAVKEENNEKKIVNGKIKASTAREARQEIKNLGFIPINVYEETKSGAKKEETPKNDHIPKLRSLTTTEKINFTSTFKLLMQSGVPVIESLVFLENEADSPKLREAAGVIKAQILAGNTYSETIARYPDIFGHVYIGLTKAGEDSGEMEKTLTRLVELLKKQDEIKGRVVGALIYPVFVICLAIAALMIMLMFVFPAFKDLFTNLGDKLPIYTKICLQLGEFLKAYWIIIPIGIISIVGGCYYALKNETTKNKIDELLLKIPIIKDLLIAANLSNFFAVMQVAFDAGIPVIDSLYLGNITITNSILNKELKKASRKIQTGQRLSVALKNIVLIPKMMVFLISIGEQSGRLGEMLTQSVIYIDEKLDKVIDTITKMIEPIMLIMIGSMVLFLALSLYLPIFKSYEM